MARSIALFALTALLGLTSATEHITVKSGESIQAAINKACAGARITVKSGTYPEIITIKKDGIQLIGEPGAMIVPPDPILAKTNLCTGLAGPGTYAGICIIGTDVKLGPYPGQEHRPVQTVGHYVDGVTVEGFTVSGFSGLNIAIVGANRAVVQKNTLYDGATYGLLTVGSKSSEVRNNKVYSADLKFIAICMDDKSDVKVSYNTISQYGIALCVQTNDARVSHNTVTDCCYGAIVDPGVDGAQLTHNKVGKSNQYCNPYFGGYATGILVNGATNTVVKYNDVQYTSDMSNPNNTAAGIALQDLPGLPTKGTIVEYNIFKHNELDVLNNSTAKNTIKNNQCLTPRRICANQ